MISSDIANDNFGPGRVSLGQLLVIGLSLLWGLVPGFAFIDLDAAIPPGDPVFHDHWVLEGSWGALVSSMIVAPLLAVAVRPALASEVARHQAVVAACFVIAALLCGSVAFLVLPLGLGVSTLAWWSLLRIASHARASSERAVRWWALLFIGAGYLLLPLVAFGPEAFTVKTVAILVCVGSLAALLAHRSPTRSGVSEGPRRLSPGLLVAVLVVAGPLLGYALRMAAESRAGFDYVGSGVDRVVAQAALPVLLVALLLMAVLGWLPTRLAVWPATVAGMAVGAFGILYPDHLASLGAVWGVAALVGSICVLVIVEVVVPGARK